MECEERYREVSDLVEISFNSSENCRDWFLSFSRAIVRLNASSAVQRVVSEDESRVSDFFRISFHAVWGNSGIIRDKIIVCFERLLSAPFAPTMVVESLLNLIEYMDLSECPLPLNISVLARAAEKHQFFAKALYLREMEFRESRLMPSSECVEALIAVNIKLGNLDAVQGLLRSPAAGFVQVRPLWHEKLENWQGALSSYSVRLLEQPDNQDWLSGRLRCLESLGEWERLSKASSGDNPRCEAVSCFNLQKWDELGRCMQSNDLSSFNDESELLVYQIVCAIHNKDFSLGMLLIERARSSTAPMQTEKTAQLDLLQDILAILKSPATMSVSAVREKFDAQLRSLDYSIQVWQRLVPLRALVLDPVSEDLDVWVRFSNLARKKQNLVMSDRIVDRFSAERPDFHGLILSKIKNLYAMGKKQLATRMLDSFLHTESLTAQCSSYLMSKCWLALALWLPPAPDPAHVLSYVAKAVAFDPRSFRARNALAIAKFREAQEKGFGSHVTEAVTALFDAVSFAVGEVAQLPNLLRLLTLWFSFYGSCAALDIVFEEGFERVPVKIWVQAIPQILARLRSRRPLLRDSINRLLARVAKEYPQEVVFPLTVGSSGILNVVKKIEPKLVEECALVAEELVRISSSWTEMWAATLEEASRMYFIEKNVSGMLSLLCECHEKMQKGTYTPSELSFRREHGFDLNCAHQWLQKYLSTLDGFYLEQAWGIYHALFQKLHSQVSELKGFSLAHASPKLNSVSNSCLHVPGSRGAAKVHSFVSTVEVVISKQKPRIVKILGSDGKRYQFLLKGNEDLKLDQRVMQLFGLVNSIISESVACNKRSGVIPASSGVESLQDVYLKRFAVVPLSSNAGLIEWVPECDTLHALIKQIRLKQNIPLSLEHNLMRRSYPKYEDLPLLDKVSVFQEALTLTSGEELRKSMWLTSAPGGAQTWVKRRSMFARSLAVTSIVGYILGLGDRHPSNLLIEQQTGQVVHIDFGDCFDLAATRDRYPEKIPFRLTRQLVNALEASGVEGMFRVTAERMMDLVRKNSDSIVAMLEAFVYDPVITWRLCVENMPHGPKNDSDALSQHAKKIIDRVHAKLIGNGNSVSVHVDDLIREAMAPENLAQCYVGWCPFW